jgi:hypothetical protein
MTHIEKQAKAHEHVSRPDYSDRSQVVESELTLNKTTVQAIAIVEALRGSPPAPRTIKFGTPSPLLNRLLARGVTR